MEGFSVVHLFESRFLLVCQAGYLELNLSVSCAHTLQAPLLSNLGTNFVTSSSSLEGRGGGWPLCIFRRGVSIIPALLRHQPASHRFFLLRPNQWITAQNRTSTVGRLAHHHHPILSCPPKPLGPRVAPDGRSNRWFVIHPLDKSPSRGIPRLLSNRSDLSACIHRRFTETWTFLQTYPGLGLVNEQKRDLLPR